MSYELLTNNKEFEQWIIEVKQLVKQSQLKASVRVNTEMLKMYWEIGKQIEVKHADAIWGKSFYKEMSRELRETFSGVDGFSVTNLKYMKKFYVFYSNRQQVVDDLESIYSIPWGHNIVIFTKCKNVNEAMFYVNKTTENGWSRNMLLNYIDSHLYKTQGKAITNFNMILPDKQSEMANEILKDPYNFDFLMMKENYKERELEIALTDNISKFLLELGRGFAYVGKQVPVIIGNKEMMMDLLFYHLRLRCYVVIELKIGEFEPAYVGQLGTYMVAVNHQLKTKEDNVTLGLLICKTKDNVVAQYSLEASSQPIGVSAYNLSRYLPPNYENGLPSAEEIEKGIQSIMM